MTEFTLSCADVCQVASNTLYPHQQRVTDVDVFLKCVRVDHVAGCLKGGTRNNANVYDVDCVIMDCDNPEDDKTYHPDDVRRYLGDVEYYTAPSRHNDKPKGEKSARPRWHAYFPLSRKLIAVETEALRAAIYDATGDMFDRGAGGASRFIYGNPDVDYNDVCVYEGRPVDEILGVASRARVGDQNRPFDATRDKTVRVDGGKKRLHPETIPEGKRHATLMKTAVKAVNNHSLEDARRIFENACARCKPAQNEQESEKIWEWAVAHKDDERETSQRRRTVTMRTVEEVLREHNIKLSFNVISRLARVSELPADSALLPEGYEKLSHQQRVKAAAKLLPTFVETYFGQEGYRVPRRLIEDELACIAEVNRYNPVREMIMSKDWDGEDRITQLTRDVMKLSPKDAALTRKWLHQAVSLGLNDDGEFGGQFMLVLQGAQGIGKTELFRHLAYDASLFGEGLSIDMRDKDTIIQASTVWIGEIGELDSTLKREQANLKSFITAKYDTYRKPYARNPEQIERHSCFCGTVNPEQVLRDETGHRRYVITHVDGLDLKFIHEGMTKDWVQQLWAQVYVQDYLPSPGGFYLTQEEQRDLKERNTKYVIPLDGETELCDRLDWGASRSDWRFTTLSRLKETLELRLDPRKISRALSAVLTKKGFEAKDMRRLVNGRTEYLLPPLWTESNYLDYGRPETVVKPTRVEDTPKNSTIEELEALWLNDDLHKTETPKTPEKTFRMGGLRF